MISASHNKYPDNGIKLFATVGRKLRDEVEAALEAELDALVHHGNDASAAPTGDAIGSVSAAPEHLLGYADSVVSSIEERTLGGLKVVVDCANGSATTIAPHVLRRLGADVTVIHADPTGTNINEDCGSTHPQALSRTVVEKRADVGLAFDGDADRVLAVDAKGDLVDGDQIIAICALDLRDRGRLHDDTVVVTVMTNLGFRRAMDEHGIRIQETAVGDRFVLDALDAGGYSLGGEQSGHVIFPQLATTGDGLLTGVQLLDVMVRGGRPLDKLASVMTRFPQVLRNVHVQTATDADELDARLSSNLVSARETLGEAGRILVRRSGTEPLVRVMVEAETTEQAETIADQVAAAVAAATS
jgi:phosphoglucosamine mutase